MSEKKPKTGKKRIVLTVIVLTVVVLSAGGLVFYFILRPPIPRDADYAHILSVSHVHSTNIQNPLTINLTFTFGNGETTPTIYQRFHTHSLRLELLLWRPNTGQFPVYVVQNILYNVSFPKIGLWSIEINLDYAGLNSSVFIWDFAG